MLEITLKTMRFQARVGILPHERVTAQPIEIDLTVSLADGDGIVDYRELYAAAASVMATEPIEYLEEIASRVADHALASGTRVRVARVAVRKPRVALGGPLDYAEIVVQRNASA